MQISLTQSSTLFALPISSSSSSKAGITTSLHQHLLKTYPHTRLQLPAPVWPATGMKLLFTLAEFSAHVSSKMKARKKRILGGEEGVRVVVSGYLSLVLVGVDLVLLFKRNMLFLGSWFVRPIILRYRRAPQADSKVYSSNGNCTYTSTPNTHICTCASTTTKQSCILTWSPNPSIVIPPQPSPRPSFPHSS